MSARTPDELWNLIPCSGDAPIAAGCNRYRVTVIEWVSHDLLVDAPSKEEAEQLGEELWCELGGDAFKCRDSGLDTIDVWLLEEGQA